MSNGKSVLICEIQIDHPWKSSPVLEACGFQIRAPYNKKRLAPLVSHLTTCHGHTFVVSRDRGHAIWCSKMAYECLKRAGFLQQARDLIPEQWAKLEEASGS